MSTVSIAPAFIAPARIAPVTPIRPLAWSGSERAASTPRPKLRITGRGRAALAVAVAIPIALFAITAFDVDAVATQTPGDATFSYISVAAGESLWDIAGYIAPDADPREVVADLVQLNALGSADVHAGERLAIPAEYAD